VVGLALLAVAAVYLAGAVRGEELFRVASAVLADPLGLAAALAAYAAAFGLRTWAWTRVLPGLPARQAWAAIHVSLLGNHVLPLRLGEALRPVSVTRRTAIGWGPATSSTVALRAADLLAVLALALLVSPVPVRAVAGDAGLAAAVVALLAVLAVGVAWGRRHAAAVRVPGTAVLGSALLAWALEAAVVWQVAQVAGVDLSAYEAVGVTAVTIAAQAVAVTPGGFGTYEAAATAAMVAAGIEPGVAFAVALTTHAVKTVYSLVVGGVALVLPAPTFWGRLRLPRTAPARPPALPIAPDAPVVVMIPVHDEEDAVGGVVSRVPSTCAGRPVELLVVDDGSTDRSAAIAHAAGARVVAQPRNLGLGAAVRRGLAEASAVSPAAVVYLDADGEYFPEDIATVVAPVLEGSADYVVGSRFRGDIRRMLPHRRAGNLVLTRWVRWMTRRPDLSDGQSGFRAFSPAAAADGEVAHDYNYAQVLTLDLLSKGYAYAEVPIRYAFRESGTSFVRLGRYLRRVLPAVHRELQTPPVAQSSTTWSANRARAADQAVSSREPSARSAATAS
ncbi:MAG TPA: lysylphosphatidylglycerol synthase domain-containing protein, partial [Actinomycetes bacterium]|nr:lysylphosphatidylglycerol synthase domain-containing protein [Actinomycetes bacterium]